jgi:hypothetical protein
MPSFGLDTEVSDFWELAETIAKQSERLYTFQARDADLFTVLPRCKTQDQLIKDSHLQTS